MADHAQAVVDGEATRIDAAARDFCAMGARLAAAEGLRAQAAGLHFRDGSPIEAGRSATLSHLLQRRCPGAATPGLNARPVAISERETDVAVLALQELSSREIAERLYLSRRTVDNHLGSIYRRLGCTDEMSSGSCWTRSVRPTRDDGRMPVRPLINHARALGPGVGMVSLALVLRARDVRQCPRSAGACRVISDLRDTARQRLRPGSDRPTSEPEVATGWSESGP